MEDSYSELAQEVDTSRVRVAKFQADLDREFSAEKFGLKSFPTIVFMPKSSNQVIKYPSERRDVDTLKMWINSMAGKSE